MDPRFQMGVFLLAGILLMLSHHFFYKYLDSQSIDSSLFAVHGFTLSDQSVSSIIGNTIAYVARTVLSAGIGVVFVQVLWSKLRREPVLREADRCVGGMQRTALHPRRPSNLALCVWLAAIAADGFSHVAHFNRSARFSTHPIIGLLLFLSMHGVDDRSRKLEYRIIRRHPKFIHHCWRLELRGRPREAHEAVGPSPHGRCSVESHKSLRGSMRIRHQV